MERQLSQQRAAERKKTLEMKQAAFTKQKQQESQLKMKLAKCETEQNHTAQQIKTLEAQLPELTGLFKKGKRQKVEEDLAKANANLQTLARTIQETKQQIEACQQLQLKTQDEIKRLKQI